MWRHTVVLEQNLAGASDRGIDDIPLGLNRDEIDI
jgi:hypothetical protein